MVEDDQAESNHVVRESVEMLHVNSYPWENHLVDRTKERPKRRGECIRT